MSFFFLISLLYPKFESPMPKEALCKDSWKLAQWFWIRRFFLHFDNVFLIFCYVSRWKRVWSFIIIQKMKPPSTKNTFCSVWLKLAPWFWKKKMKCDKFTDGLTVGRQAITKPWAFNSEMWGIPNSKKVSLILYI